LRATTKKRSSTFFGKKKCTPRQNPGYAYESKIGYVMANVSVYSTIIADNNMLSLWFRVAGSYYSRPSYDCYIAGYVTNQRERIYHAVSSFVVTYDRKRDKVLITSQNYNKILQPN